MKRLPFVLAGLGLLAGLATLGGHGVFEYLQTKGLRVVEASLRAVVGKGPCFVTDEAHYRQYVIRPGWEALPRAVRMAIGRRYPLWDQMYLRLREEPSTSAATRWPSGRTRRHGSPTS